MARVASYFQAIIEVALIDSEHHLHHFASRLLRLLVVLIECAFNMAVFALHAQRSGDELHRRNELVGRNPFQNLNVLEGLVGCSYRWWSDALRNGELRQRDDQERSHSAHGARQS